MMAGCSKNIEPVSSPDPDAWIYDASLPVPIRFNSGSLLETKAGGPINVASDMVGKEFGFFAFHNNMPGWGISTGNSFYDNGIDGWSQNMVATCTVHPDDDKRVQFEFYGGPYYYPQTSENNYTFYGYHARTTEVRPNTGLINVVVELGYDDILWAKAEAESFDLKDEDDPDVTNTYEGYNARYIRKSLMEDNNGDGNPDNIARHPFMTFEHLTSCVSFSAETEKSVYAENHEGKDVVTVTAINIIDTPIKANLCVANRNDSSLEGTLTARSEVGSIGSGSIDVVLTEATQPLYATPFFILPSESITVEIEYTVASGEESGKTVDFVSTYTLTPEVKNGDKAGETGFFAGYKYNYNFVVYTPERITIEAEVTPYESAFGEGVYEDVYPDNE